MACTLMRSLHDSCRWMNRRRPVAFAIILALLVPACGRHQTSEEASGPSPLFPAPLGTAWGFIDKDRKSTRLNSSHANISYAVFCLKKKKKITQGDRETER